MDAQKPLIETSSLRTKTLGEKAKNKEMPIVRYDREFDSFMLLFVPPMTETVVHYVDDHVALLYEPESREIVGLQIEDFVRSFLPNHASLQKIWRLSEAMGSKEKVKDLGDMIFIVETVKPKMVREVIEASGKSFEGRSTNVAEAFAGAY